MPFAGIDRIGRIQCLLIELNFDDLSGFVDDERCPPGSFGLRIEDSIAPGDIAADVAQHWEVGTEFVRPSFIGKEAIHRDTQDLGVGSFQLLQILLEALRFVASIGREGKDIERQSYVLLPPEVLQGNRLPTLIFQSKVGRHLSDFDGGRR